MRLLRPSDPELKVFASWRSMFLQLVDHQNGTVPDTGGWGGPGELTAGRPAQYDPALSL